MAAKDAIARGEGYQGKKFLAKQKRWEKKGGAGPAPDAASAAARGTGKGFQIGPKPQKGIYTGKGAELVFPTMMCTTVLAELISTRLRIH